MALPFIIANLPAGNNPASVLDANFNALGNQVNIYCATGGTPNAIVLSPISNMPALTAYAPGNLFSFQASATSTGLVTISVAGLGALAVYTASGVQAGSGSFVNGFAYTVMYVPTLVGGATPGFILVNAAIPVNVPPLNRSFANLKTQVLSSSTINLSYDQVTVQNAGGGIAALGSGSFTINTGANNVVNGYDATTSALAAATWYGIFAIWNPSTLTAGGYMSSNFSTPLLPSGFTYWTRLGAVRTAAASTNLLGSIQYARRAQYMLGVGGLSPASGGLPQMANGVAGNINTPTWVAVATGNFVPPTASSIRGIATLFSTTAVLIAAPNNSYGPWNSTTFPPPVILTATAGGSVSYAQNFEFKLESSNIFWASGETHNALWAFGWEDNL